MGRWIRISTFLFLINLLAASLFITAYPAMAQTEDTGAPANPDAPVNTDASFLGHIVQPGEDLATIAARYNTTPAALATTNHLSPTAQLFPGQLLRIRSWGEQPQTPDPTGAQPGMPEANPQIAAQQVLTGEKWIDVDLSEQTLTAYQGDTVVRSFLISSGLPTHPTVTGTFHIWAKVAGQTMTGGSRAAGDYYNLPNVQWVQYFYQDYSIHGTYWHNNFGHPMSHGCVNMQTEDAQWLFDWAAPRMDEAMVTSRAWLVHAEDSTRVEVHD